MSRAAQRLAGGVIRADRTPVRPPALTTLEPLTPKPKETPMSAATDPTAALGQATPRTILDALEERDNAILNLRNAVGAPQVNFEGEALAVGRLKAAEDRVRDLLAAPILVPDVLPGGFASAPLGAASPAVSYDIEPAPEPRPLTEVEQEGDPNPLGAAAAQTVQTPADPAAGHAAGPTHAAGFEGSSPAPGRGRAPVTGKSLAAAAEEAEAAAIAAEHVAGEPTEHVASVDGEQVAGMTPGVTGAQPIAEPTDA